MRHHLEVTDCVKEMIQMDRVDTS